MGVNITVDGLTYSGVEQMYVGGKSLALSVDAGANYGPSLLDGTLETISDSTVTALRSFALIYSPIKNADFPNVTHIYQGAFQQCAQLKSVNVPSAISIDAQAFYQCSALSSIDAQACVTIGDSAFYSCSHISTFAGYNVSKIGRNAFSGCYSLISAPVENALSISVGAFTYCNSLQSVNLNKLSVIPAIFNSCANLSEVSLLSATSLDYVFMYCYHLLSLNIGGSAVPTLAGSAAFRSTPIDGYTASTGGVYGSIYVPASLLTAYQSATNWAFFSERFVGV